MTKQAITIKKIFTATLTIALFVLVGCGGDNHSAPTNANLNTQLLPLDQQNESVYPDSYRPGLGFGSLLQYVMEFGMEVGNANTIYQNRLAINMQVLGTDDTLLACETVKNAEIHLRRYEHPILDLNNPAEFETTTRVLPLTQEDCVFDDTMHFTKFANFQSESIAPLWAYLVKKDTHQVYAFGATEVISENIENVSDHTNAGGAGGTVIGL